MTHLNFSSRVSVNTTPAGKFATIAKGVLGCAGLRVLYTLIGFEPACGSVVSLTDARFSAGKPLWTGCACVAREHNVVGAQTEGYD